MDFALRCNSLKCRAQLTEWAVVTTCSHIFCLPCSDALGLASAAITQRICPACSTSLPNPDDAVRTQLNPTEDYKTSVLSGLSPTIITECAGRALGFWSYQSSQEIIFQEFTARSLKDKYEGLNNQVDKIINDANSQIDILTQKVQAMLAEQDKLKSENLNIMGVLKEKNRKYQQAQEQLKRIESRERTTATQNAAFDSVNELLSNSQAHSAGAYGQAGFEDSQDSLHSIRTQPGISAASTRRPGMDFNTHNLHMSRDAGATPRHRQQLGSVPGAPSSQLRPTMHLNSWQSQSTSIRTPLTSLSRNSLNRSVGNHGSGLSAGMRKGTPQASRMGRYPNSHGGYS